MPRGSCLSYERPFDVSSLLAPPSPERPKKATTLTPGPPLPKVREQADRASPSARSALQGNNSYAPSASRSPLPAPVSPLLELCAVRSFRTGRILDCRQLSILPAAPVWMTPQINYRMLAPQLVAAGKATAAGGPRRANCQEDRRAEYQYLISIACISVRLHRSLR